MTLQASGQHDCTAGGVSGSGLVLSLSWDESQASTPLKPLLDLSTVQFILFLKCVKPFLLSVLVGEAVSCGCCT